MSPVRRGLHQHSYRMRSIAWRAIVIFLAGMSISGCESVPSLFKRTTAGTSEEAANIFVSAYPAIPWSDIGEKLEPNHNLSTEQARGLAAQTTQAQVSQFLSTFAVGLGIGLPSRSDTTTTALGADGQQTTTASRTRGTGTPPGSSGVASTAISDAALAPDLSKGPLALGLDANTALTAGTAVYQLGKILDNQITKGYLPKGYQVHLLTLQVNLQPKGRDYAYDAYVNVSLLPGKWAEALGTSMALSAHTDALPPVIVYPLVITDALETTSTGRSLEVIRQAALQLLGVIGAVGVNAGVSGGSNRLDSIIGTDKNSLVTLGRVSDHSIRIRLGAQNSGSSGLAMVPRTHNVSLVVLTQWDEADESKRVRALSAITHTTLVPSDGGKELTSGRERDRSYLASRVEDAIKNYGFGPVPIGCSALVNDQGVVSKNSQLTGESLNEEIRISKYLDLLRALDRGDYNRVQKCLGLEEDIGVQRQVALHRLLANLMEIQTSSRYSKLLISLKAYPDPELPDNGQLVLLTDDGKSSSTFVLRGGKGLSIERLKAELALKVLPPKEEIPQEDQGARENQKKKLAAKAVVNKPAPKSNTGIHAAATDDTVYKLLPSDIKVAGAGAEVQISFSSLAALNMSVDGINRPLTLTYDYGEKPKLAYAVRLVTKADDKGKGPSNPVRAPGPVIVADGNGLGRITLQVGTIPKGFAPPMRLVVSGADVREDKAIGAPGLTNKGVPIAAETAVTLSLGNLTLARTVSIATYDKDDKAIGEPIILAIDRAVQVNR